MIASILGLTKISNQLYLKKSWAVVRVFHSSTVYEL